MIHESNKIHLIYHITINSQIYSKVATLKLKDQNQYYKNNIDLTLQHTREIYFPHVKRLHKIKIANKSMYTRKKLGKHKKIINESATQNCKSMLF